MSPNEWLQAKKGANWAIYASKEADKKYTKGWSFSGAQGALLSSTKALIVGGRDFPRETYDETSLLEVYDLNENQWVQGHDVDGNLTRRIGHSATSWNKNAYVFGGETTPDTVHGRTFLNDLYRVSFKEEEKILHSEQLEISTSSQNPSARAWHASTLVKYTSSPENQKEESLLIMGGKDESKFLSDIWILTSETSTTTVDSSSTSESTDPATKEVSSDTTPKTFLKWTQLTPSGPSPLPLANHTLVPFDEGSKVLVIGGRSSNSSRLNSSVHVLDLKANEWSTLSLSSNIEGRFGHTAVALTLPIDESTGEILPVFEGNQDALEETNKRDLVLIFGGITDSGNASTTSIVLLDPVKGSVYDLSLPNLGFESYTGHATITSEDKRFLFVFGGVDFTTGLHLDAVSYLPFWEKQAPDSIASYKSNHNQKQTITYPNGDIYEGFLDDEDHKTGEGKCTYANGDIYEGTWENDLKSGQGTMLYANGNIYVGLWSQDVPYGQGILEIHPTSSTGRQEIKFVGNFSIGKRYGEGSLTYTDGSILHGYWQDDILSVTGKIEKYDDGNGTCTYYGEIQRDGLPHGQGTGEYARETYFGIWFQGKRCGQGKLTCQDGTVYTGTWRNGKRNGFGTCQYTRTKDLYEGKWVGGVRCGTGVCKYANGSEYKGEWKDDQCHGKGTFTFPNGQSHQGVWKQNVFIGENAFEINQLLEEIEFIASNRTNTLK